MISLEDIRKALNKPALYGPDIDLSKYEVEEPEIKDSITNTDTKLVEAANRVGLSSLEKISYIQVNESAMFRFLQKMLKEYGVVVMPLKKALEEYDLAKKLSWNIVRPDLDKYTASAYLYGGEIGYFVYVPPKTRVPLPIYTCLVITRDKRVQYAHNIVYVDEGSEAHIVTGCSVPHGVREGIHIGISEFYVGYKARLTYSMIHAWTEGLHVRPRTGVRVLDGGEYVSYYVIYSPIASLQTYPVVYLSEKSRAYMATVVAASGEGVYDIGSKAVLEGKGSSVEIVSRTVAKDRSRVYARAEILAKTSDTRGHIECLGLLLSKNSSISSIPVITSMEPGALLSHEAAIGVIAQDELEYLMSKGFTEDEAKAILIRGFMSIEAPGIPRTVKAEVNRILDLVTKYAVG